MYNDIPLFFLRESTKKWNPTAKDCYEINCDCTRCFIYKTYFKHRKSECMMKYCVKYLLMKIGAPDNSNTISA